LTPPSLPFLPPTAPYPVVLKDPTITLTSHPWVERIALRGNCRTLTCSFLFPQESRVQEALESPSAQHPGPGESVEGCRLR